ncbi:MAG TPA: hypothetical protein VFD15_06395 [Clostridia bacterium]|nr:hypothetical protein [Clostridia bacterium]
MIESYTWKYELERAKIENENTDILKDALYRLGLHDDYIITREEARDILGYEKYWITFEDDYIEEAYIEIRHKHETVCVELQWTDTGAANRPPAEWEIRELIIALELEPVTISGEEKIRAGIKPPLQIVKIIENHREKIMRVIKRVAEERKKRRLLQSNLPKIVPIPKHNFDNDEIVVAMSCGMPVAYIKALEKNENGESYNIEYLQPGSKKAEGTPLYLQRWCRIINELLYKNGESFENAMYYETMMDREVGV